MSSSAQLRKIKKPLIERRRRERINDSLNQLKNLVLEATNKDETRYSKMEKADILEMTVSYLRATHCRRFRPGPDADRSGGSVDRYVAGFRECVVHVGQYLLDAGVSCAAVHDRLMSHLDKALQAVVDTDGQEFETSVDVAADKVLWTGDCDTTGRCSPDTDDDDDYASVTETVSDVDDVIRRQFARCGTAPSTDTTTATTSMTYRQPLHSVGDADSPGSTDEFPSFPPTTSATVAAADDYSSSLPSDVVDDIDNDLEVACDVRVMTSSSISSCDSVSDDSSDVWRPWR